MSPPFIIFALPRSRTYWLSRFLSYGEYACFHEQARYVRAMEDVRSWLAQGHTGTAETSVARWWRLVRHYRPDAKILVVRRPVDEVVDSLCRLDMRGVCTFDRAKLAREMGQLDRRLDQIEREVPDALSVTYADLANESTCARVFEHCLPYPFDAGWWEALSATNLQANMQALMRYTFTHKAQLLRAASVCKKQVRYILKAASLPAEIEDAGMVICREPFGRFYQDARELFARHCSDVGEPEDEYLCKNAQLAERLDAAGRLHVMTARSNGRMFGYLMTVIGPSLESPGRVCATQTTFYASKDVPGLGMKIQRATLAALKERGVDEVIMRAGVRGAGARLGTLYRRLGAENYGQLFNLRLERSWDSVQPLPR